MTATATADGISGQDLLAELADARARLHVDRQLGEWCFELQARLRRAKATPLHPDCRRHHAILAAEIERFKLCVQLAKARAAS